MILEYSSHPYMSDKHTRQQKEKNTAARARQVFPKNSFHKIKSQNNQLQQVGIFDEFYH